MNSRKFTLSVVMPNYNDAKYISTAIEAILSQSYQPDEFIICDDASTDNSADIIQAYAERYPLIRFIRNESNMGTISLVNRMAETAAGDYIYLAGSDDYILPGFLEKSMGLLTTYPNAGFSAAFAYTMDEKGKITGIGYIPGMSRQRGFMSPEKIFNIINKIGSGMFAVNTMVFKRKHLTDNGGFTQEIRYFHDVALASAIAARHGACFIPEPLICIMLRKGSFSASFYADSERVKEGIANAVCFMNNKYSTVLPEHYISSFEKNMNYDNYFNSISAKRRAILKKCRFLLARVPSAGNIAFSIIKTFLYINDAVKCIHYLYKHKLSFTAYIGNYIDTILYLRKHRHMPD